MKVLVINASANKERSTTLKLTKAFLDGLGYEASEVEYVTTISLLFAMRHMYGKNISYICCAEGSLFVSPNTESITTPYLANVRQAGAEYKETERISDDTQTYRCSLPKFSSRP